MHCCRNDHISLDKCSDATKPGRVAVVPRLTVVLVPISLAPYSEGNDVKVVAYKPRGWLERTVGSGQVGQVTQELIAQVPGFDPEHVPAPDPESVGFLLEGDTTRLVFTAPIPMAATLSIGIADDDPEWIALPTAGQTAVNLDAVHSLVLHHWRRALADTTAAFDLLPQYFTTSQVRSIYATVWGESRDWSNFHRWLHTSNRGICREEPVQQVSRAVEGALSTGLTAGTFTAAALGDHPRRQAAVRAASRYIGISPMALGPIAGAVAPLVVAAAVTGGLVAYQRQITRGKTPSWFTRTSSSRVVLFEQYTPRPEWMRPGQGA